MSHICETMLCACPTKTWTRTSIWLLLTTCLDPEDDLEAPQIGGGFPSTNGLILRGCGLSGPVSTANQERETTYCNMKVYLSAQPLNLVLWWDPTAPTLELHCDDPHKLPQLDRRRHGYLPDSRQ